MKEAAEIWKLRIARRLLIAEQELLKQAEAHSELVLELIGSAVADWALAQCKLLIILTEEQEAPPTSSQLENLKNCGFLGKNQFHVLSTAYRARNLAHHEQIGLHVELCVQLLNAVRWALQFPTLSEANGSHANMPINQDELFDLMHEVSKLNRTKARRKGSKQIVIALYQDQPFHSDWGPSKFTHEERMEITQAVARRGMLSGVIKNLHWPLISCDVCNTVVSIDNCMTPQEECMSESPLDTFEAFCVWGCSKAHRLTVSEWIANEPDGSAWEGYQYLQNTVQMIKIGIATSRRLDEREKGVVQSKIRVIKKAIDIQTATSPLTDGAFVRAAAFVTCQSSVFVHDFRKHNIGGGFGRFVYVCLRQLRFA
jgi:hypothetical protein